MGRQPTAAPAGAAPDEKRPGGTAMKFRVERDSLADAVAWTAKSVPNRPSVPVLAGVMLRVADGRLHVSGFDYEVSSQVHVEVQADRKSTRLNSSHANISYAVFCLKKKKIINI